jgi:hypothetical protein
MKLKRWLCLAVVLCLCLSAAGCAADENAVFVQSVAKLAGMGGIAPGDKFPGMVVSEHVTEIPKDGNKAVAELYVKEGWASVLSKTRDRLAQMVHDESTRKPVAASPGSALPAPPAPSPVPVASPAPAASVAPRP